MHCPIFPLKYDYEEENFTITEVNHCMSIMIFNVNIYRTSKKNRILKIKWNKYIIIQFPQCLFEEISMEMSFIYIFIYIFINQLLWFKGMRPVPPEKYLQRPRLLFITNSFNTCAIFSFFFLCLFVCLFFLASVHLQQPHSIHVLTSQTNMLNFKERCCHPACIWTN